MIPSYDLLLSILDSKVLLVKGVKGRAGQWVLGLRSPHHQPLKREENKGRQCHASAPAGILQGFCEHSTYKSMYRVTGRTFCLDRYKHALVKCGFAFKWYQLVISSARSSLLHGEPIEISKEIVRQLFKFSLGQHHCHNTGSESLLCNSSNILGTLQSHSEHTLRTPREQSERALWESIQRPLRDHSKNTSLMKRTCVTRYAKKFVWFNIVWFNMPWWLFHIYEIYVSQHGFQQLCILVQVQNQPGWIKCQILM